MSKNQTISFKEVNESCCEIYIKGENDGNPIGVAHRVIKGKWVWEIQLFFDRKYLASAEKQFFENSIDAGREIVLLWNIYRGD